MVLTNSTTIGKPKTIIWLVGVSFLLFQFFLQLSSGIVIGFIMDEQKLSALAAGFLSSAFYYVYTSLQIPVGLLFDRYNTRTLLSLNAGICALGCFVFASSYSLPILFLGRLIIGAGSAFAFIGLSHIIRQNYLLNQYAFMVGLSETLGFTVTVLGMIGMGTFISHLGWRSFIVGAGIIGLVIAVLCRIYIPSNKPINIGINNKQQLILILKNKLAWVNGLFVCLEFSVITLFGAMWAVPFFQLKLQCSLKVASILTSIILLGAGLSCPVFGQLSIRLKKRKPLMHFSCLSTAILLLIILYIPSNNLLLIGFLMFAIGLCCGAYMLAYSIANELSPPQARSTHIGFTNTLAMMSAPLLQPLVGYLLDYFSHYSGVYTLSHYQSALSIIPCSLVLASVLVHFLPEKNS